MLKLSLELQLSGLSGTGDPFSHLRVIDIPWPRKEDVDSPQAQSRGFLLSLDDHLILCTSFLGVKPRVCNERQEAQGFGTFPALSTAKLKPLTFFKSISKLFLKTGKTLWSTTALLPAVQS